MANITIDRETLECLILAAENWAEELDEHIIPAEEESWASALGWTQELENYEADRDRSIMSAKAARFAITAQTKEN